MEKDKDKQDLEIESIIQVTEEGMNSLHDSKSGKKKKRQSMFQHFYSPFLPCAIGLHEHLCVYIVFTACCVSQHARELETRRREAEERERKKQREVQMELERQLKEAEMVTFYIFT